MAALCRKVALAKEGDSIEVWGDGCQQRSFLYIEDCLEGIWHLMKASNVDRPLNIGSSEMVSINDLAKLIIQQSNKALTLRHIDGPVGVDARSSDNTLAKKTIQWQPKVSLEEGVNATYSWISEAVKRRPRFPSNHSFRQPIVSGVAKRQSYPSLDIRLWPV